MVKEKLMKTLLNRKNIWLSIGILLFIIGILTLHIGVIKSLGKYAEPGVILVHPLYNLIGGLIEISLGLAVVNEKFFRSNRYFRKR